MLNNLQRAFRADDGKSELQLINSENEQNRKELVFRYICYIVIALYANAIVILSIFSFIIGSLQILVGVILYVIALPVMFIPLRANIKKNYTFLSRLIISVLFVPLTYVAWLFDNVTAVPFALYILVIAISLALVNGFDLIIITIISIVLCGGIYLNSDLFHLLNSPAFFTDVASTIVLLLTVGVLIPGIVAMVYVPSRSQLEAIRLQNNSLQAALAELNQRQNLNQQVSQQVLSQVIQLNTNAIQQASGSQEQVTTIAEINTSLSELSATAKNIADLVNQVDKSANEAVSNTTQIAQIASNAVKQGSKGLSAVQNTVEATNSVAKLYGQMLETLTDLNNKNTSMRIILELLSTIASETHLLSLNAAIEAAGAGEYGERFGVVAQEVKNLAARSAEASRQVVGIVQEIESAQHQAVTTAESGYNRAIEMKEIANETGRIIAEMSAISGQAQAKMSEVNEVAREIKQSTEIIRAVTLQQSSASQQVLEALNGLTVIAQQSAEGSNRVSDSAHNLEELSKQLSFGLTN